MSLQSIAHNLGSTEFITTNKNVDLGTIYNQSVKWFSTLDDDKSFKNSSSFSDLPF